MLKKLYEKDFYRWTGNSSGGGGGAFILDTTNDIYYI